MGLDLFLTEDSQRAASELKKLARTEVVLLESTIPLALTGKRPAIRAYVGAWWNLCDLLLSVAHEQYPDAFLKSDSDFVLVDVKRRPSHVARDVLGGWAVNAPFSPWLNEFGEGLGSAVFLLSELRKIVPGSDPLPIRDEWVGLPHWEDVDFPRFARGVWLELVERTPALVRIATSWDLSLGDVATLFGVSRQAVARWNEEGPPSPRQAKLLAILESADLLERHLRPSAIPGTVRRASQRFGGLSILEMIERDRQEEVLDAIRGSFDWATTA